MYFVLHNAFRRKWLLCTNFGRNFAGATNDKVIPDQSISWRNFFAERRRLKSIQRVGGIPFVLAFWVAEGMVLSLPVFDPTTPIFGIDPIMLVAITGLGGTIASYVIGGSVMRGIFRWFKPNLTQQLEKVCIEITFFISFPPSNSVLILETSAIL